MMKRIAAIGFCLVLLFASGQLVIAQEKHKQSYTIPGEYRKYVTQNIIKVQDIPGHQLRIFELQTNYPSDWPHKTAGLRPVKGLEWLGRNYELVPNKKWSI